MSRTIITVAVVLMLLLAGCSSSTAPPASSEDSSIEVSNSPSEDKSVETSNTSQSLDDASETTETTTKVDQKEAIQTGELTEDSQPITDETRQTMETLSRDFYQELPSNETQRRAETVRAAQTLCSDSDTSVFDTVDKFDRQSPRLTHATNTINEHFNKEISTNRLQSMMSGVDKISKFTPLVGSYNRMYDASCEVDQNDDESIEQFYMASAAFGVEAALVQQQVFFKSSFVATRYTTNRLSLMKLRTVTGNKGYGLLLSEVHWAYRGGQAKATSYIFEKSAELDLNVSDVNRHTITTVADKQFEKYRANASRTIDTAREGAKNTTQIMEECAAQTRANESDSLWNQARDRINNINDGLRSGLQNVSEVEPSDIPKDVNESIDRPEEFTSCVESRLKE